MPNLSCCMRMKLRPQLLVGHTSFSGPWVSDEVDELSCGVTTVDHVQWLRVNMKTERGRREGGREEGERSEEG